MTFCFFTCMNIYICMFLKQEKPEIDDIERRRKTLVLKKKNVLRNIFEKVFKFLRDTLAKNSQNICAYSFVSEHSKHFFYTSRTRPLRMQVFFTCSHWQAAKLTITYSEKIYEVFKHMICKNCAKVTISLNRGVSIIILANNLSGL